MGVSRERGRSQGGRRAHEASARQSNLSVVLICHCGAPRRHREGRRRAHEASARRSNLSVVLIGHCGAPHRHLEQNRAVLKAYGAQKQCNLENNGTLMYGNLYGNYM